MKDQKREAMFGRVDEWIKSGRTLREFSSSIGLSKSCFEYWVRKKRKASVTSPSFLEITPLANPVHDVETIAELIRLIGRHCEELPEQRPCFG